MSQKDNIIKVYIDDSDEALAIGNAPNKLEIDTTSLSDGNHTLRIVATDTDGASNEKLINFTVRNGPYIAVDGIKSGETFSGNIDVILDAYDTNNTRIFTPNTAEIPRGIPFWFWGIAIAVLAFAILYAVAFWSPNKDNFSSDSMKKEVEINNIYNGN